VQYELGAVMGQVGANSGIPHADLLVAFAEAAIGRDALALRAARDAIDRQMGAAALVDTAGVAALFNAIDRVADSTGIPIEADKAEMTAELRAELGIDKFAEAKRT
jgi:hypothetical protein